MKEQAREYLKSQCFSTWGNDIEYEEVVEYLSDFAEQHILPLQEKNRDQRHQIETWEKLAEINAKEVVGYIKELEALKQGVKKQKEYIKFLGERYNSAFQFCAVHGVTESKENINKGKRLRKEIDKLLNL